jgi:predicted membrane-bound dolichyl-phosphate-mannose-protein mannosyltransferase
MIFPWVLEKRLNNNFPFILKMRKHRLFLLIFLLFLIVKVFSLFVAHDIWWDSSVYIGMGKYIYSFGEIGLWEISRPIVWPLILGFFWKTGLDYVLFGKILVVLFSLGTLLLTYLIAGRLFNKKIALLASVFLSLSSTFFVFGNVLHTEIPSAFFVLLGFWFFIRKEYNFSGLFFGLAFMTRFFQIFAFISLFLLLSYFVMKKKESFNALFFFCFF